VRDDPVFGDSLADLRGPLRDVRDVLVNDLVHQPRQLDHSSIVDVSHSSAQVMGSVDQPP
jgi:hypothetical protein